MPNCVLIVLAIGGALQIILRPGRYVAENDLLRYSTAKRTSMRASSSERVMR